MWRSLWIRIHQTRHQLSVGGGGCSSSSAFFCRFFGGPNHRLALDFAAIDPGIEVKNIHWQEINALTIGSVR